MQDWPEADAPREGWRLIYDDGKSELLSEVWEKIDGPRTMRVLQVFSAWVFTVTEAGHNDRRGCSSRRGFAMLGAEMEYRSTEPGIPGFAHAT